MVSSPVARHRIIAGFAALASLLLIILNVMCQRLVEAGLMQDRLVLDYVTDALVVPFFASVLIAWRSRVAWPVLAALAGLFTARELLGLRDRVDGFDIALYWAGALLVQLLSYRGSRP